MEKTFAWLYFGEELHTLRRGEEFSGGVQSLAFNKPENIDGQAPSFVSMEYFQYPHGIR